MIRVGMKDGVLVCTADDWKKLESNERKFLAECYRSIIWFSYSEGGDLTFNPHGDADSKVRRIYSMKFHASNNGIEVAEDVEEYLVRLKDIAREAEERAEAARRAELAKALWKDRQENGCEGCRYSIQIGDDWFRCQYSGDELDSKFMEKWNPTIMAMEIFHEVGVPNEHCKYYVKEGIKAFGGRRENG